MKHTALWGLFLCACMNHSMDLGDGGRPQPTPAVSCGSLEARTACAWHCQCASQVCALPPMGSGAVRVCLDAKDVVYLAPPPTCNEANPGTQGQPLCSFLSALDRLTATRRTLRLAAGQYQIPALDRDDFTVVGADQEGTTPDGEVSQACPLDDPGRAVLGSAVSVGGGARLTLDSVTVRGSVLCRQPLESPQPVLRLSRVRVLGQSVTADGCLFTMDEGLVACASRPGPALSIEHSAYRVTQSTIRDNRSDGSAAVVLATTARALDAGPPFARNQVLRNDGGPNVAGAINCGLGLPVNLSDVRVCNNSQGATGELSGRCQATGRVGCY